jgi:hypothetical protein
MTIRSVCAVGALAALVGGCAPSYIVVAATGGRVAAASTAGISMAAYPETWQGHPSDLPGYLTPIWIDIVNQTSKTVRLRYEDFALTDPSGFRYAAISPYSGQPQVPTQTAPAPQPAPAAAPAAPEPAAPAPAEQPSETPTPPPSGNNNAEQPAPVTPTSALGGVTDENMGWQWSDDEPTVWLVRGDRDDRGGEPHGFRGGGEFHGGFRGGYPAHFHGYSGPHAHVFIGGGPIFYDPWWPGWWGPYPYYYGPYVYSWDNGYYPGAPSADILRLGLPEGELQPGGRVSGFIYFQHATKRPGRLDLTWSVHAEDGRSLESIRVPLAVVEE